MGNRYRRSSIVDSPTRCRSAARRGPTPFRYCRQLWSGSMSMLNAKCQAFDIELLNHQCRSVLDPDLTDARRQFEGVVHVDPRRLLRRAGGITEQLLQYRL